MERMKSFEELVPANQIFVACLKFKMKGSTKELPDNK